MAAEQVAIGLKKQDTGDPDWGDRLDEGFDDANSRLTLGGTANPNGTVPGHWVGQHYIQRYGGTPAKAANVWICTVASGIVGTSVWQPASQYVPIAPIPPIIAGGFSGPEGRPYWYDLGGVHRPHAGASIAETARFGPSVGAGHTFLGAPVVTVTCPASADIGEYSILLIATLRMLLDGSSTIAFFQVQYGTATPENVGPQYTVPENTLFTMHHLMKNVIGFTPGTTLTIKIGSNRTSGLQEATLSAMLVSRHGGTIIA